MLTDALKALQKTLQREMMDRFRRRVSLGDLVTDRWENAREYGFGEGTSCYDNVLVIGDVRVGRHCWIGPNVVLDGSGGLVIGDYCSISSGVQIYTHHTVRWSLSFGVCQPDRQPTRIGDGVYLGPNSVVSMGVSIGNRCVIGALSLVNSDIPDGMKAFGCPARVVGPADLEEFPAVPTPQA